MPADLDQFGRENSHGAVIRWIGLVQLGHVAADGGRSLDQIHLVAGVGEIQSTLNTADPAADHHHIPEIAFREAAAELFDFVFFHWGISSLFILLAYCDLYALNLAILMQSNF